MATQSPTVIFNPDEMGIQLALSLTFTVYGQTAVVLDLGMAPSII